MLPNGFVSTVKHLRLSIAAKLWLGLHLISLLLALHPAMAHAQAQRKSVANLTATELMSLRRGVAQMMAWNGAPRGSVDFRRSWIYWANIHSHFGNDCAGPIVGSGMAGVRTWTASNADETATWCTCKHHDPGNQFLTWHRMFLWFFERVLQEAAGAPSLRLPYWDYEADAHLPAAYRETTYVNEQGQTVPNPLRVSARQPGLNSGSSSLSSSVTSTAKAMKKDRYNPFNIQLQANPHDTVHCAIVTGGCINGLMGSVPASALDPIFYAHHTNIDRLYECWLHVDERKRLPTNPGQLNTPFTFIDANGGTVDRFVGDMLTTTQLGYTYAAGKGCPAASIQEAESVASVGTTRLDHISTTVPLVMSPEARRALATSSSALLTIEGLEFDEAPGGLYDVFLRTGEKREQIGMISLFGLAPSRSDTSHAGHLPSHGSFQFDITDTVKQLDIRGDAPVYLVFELTTGLSDSTPEIVAQQINPRANVRFESARLLATP
jgi:hypothetical protein